MSGNKLRLRRFDINSISSDKVVVFIGKRETGKSFLVKDLLYYHKDVPIGTVISGTEAANTFYGAMNSVAQSQVDTGKSFGMNRRQIYFSIIFPQMWRYALPGLSNLWMLLIKSTPLLFLLGIQDIVYWARELGGSKTSIFQYPHSDWRIWYFIALLVFYLLLTKVSENIIKKISQKLYIPI